MSWSQELARIGHYDFYHTYHYHKLNCRSPDEQPVLFTYELDDILFALPLILRGINHEEASTASLLDATSVYGYAGPVCSERVRAESVREGFIDELGEKLSAMRVVSVFSRLHPVLRNDWIVRGLGEVSATGATVSIDLTLSEQEQVRQYSSNHRRGLKKLITAGVTCEQSTCPDDLNEFMRIYTESMDRVGATADYYFDEKYFEDLVNSEDYQMKLFVCRFNRRVVSGGLFSSCGRIVQYHLGGTATDSLITAPSKLMFDTVRRWARETGHTDFHLGGGVGGRRDSLFSFKQGFSKKGVCPFNLWKWIVNPAIYAELVRDYGVSKCDAADLSGGAGYFPAYRAAKVRDSLETDRP